MKLSDTIKSRLPDDFNLDEIGDIDLKEAEKIANEDIVFLTEEDLIVGLEDFDLIPLEDDGLVSKNRSSTPDSAVVIQQTEKAPETTEQDQDIITLDDEDIAPLQEPSVEFTSHDTMESLDDVQKDESFDDDNIPGDIPPAEEEILKLDEEVVPLVEDEEPASEHMEEEKLALPETEELDLDSEISSQQPDTVPAEMETGFLDEDGIDELHLPEAEELIDESSEPHDDDADVESEVIEEEPVFDQSHVIGDDKVQKDSAEEHDTISVTTEDFIFYDEDQPSSEFANDNLSISSVVEEIQGREPLPDEETPELSEEPELKEVPEGEESIPAAMAESKEEETTIPAEIHEDEGYLEDAAFIDASEKLTSDLIALDEHDRTHFSDDPVVDKPVAITDTIFEENELDSVNLDIIGLMDNSGRVIREGEGNSTSSISISSQGVSEYIEELFFDFDDDEYKYKDDELEFIHTAIIEEDYSRYFQQIDEFYGTEQGKKITRAVEILGLSPDEIIEIEDTLFAEQYADIDLDEMFGLIHQDLDFGIHYHRGEKECTYILSNPDSLLDEERVSIEEDLSSSTALVFEENIELIKNELRELGEFERVESVQITAEVYDITDKVVIIEDEDDVDRFVKEFPEDKQNDLYRLLKYFDGLFEKLPEDTIKNFAESEYFDLYVQILNDLESNDGTS